MSNLDLIRKHYQEQGIPQAENTDSTVNEESSSGSKEVEPSKAEVKESKPDDSWEKRYKDLQSFKDKSLKEKEEELATLKEQLDKATAPKVELPKSEEEIKKFKDENPEMFDLLQSISRMELMEKDKEFSTKLKELEAEKTKLVLKEKGNQLLEIHPDASEIKASQEFKDWYEAQTKVKKSLFADDSSVEDWSAGLDLFKKAKGLTENKAKAAEQVTKSSKGETETSSKKPFTESQIAAMSEAEFAKNHAEIRKRGIVKG